MTRYFTKKDRNTDGQQAYEMMFNSLAIRENQFKATLRSHYTSIRMAKLNVTKPNADKDAENLIQSYTAGGNVKWFSFLKH